MTIDNEADTKKHPTMTFSQKLHLFISDIESLHRTFPLVIRLTQGQLKESKNNFEQYLQNNATDISDTGEAKRYRVPSKCAQSIRRYSKECVKSESALRLMPRQFVISLVSQYDSLVGHLIRFMFAAQPERLNASETQLTYKELIGFSDIAAAQEHVLEKEVEKVIRKSHAEQIEWLEKNLKMKIKDVPSWDTFLELTERRNLFVHLDGSATLQYVRLFGDSHNIKVGEQLGVSEEYYESAYRCIYEIAVKMSHISWRKLCPNHLEASDAELNVLTLDLISQEEYDLAIRILSHFVLSGCKLTNDACRYTMLINLAQAYKWNGQPDECSNLINGEDWSAREDKYKLAVHVLNNRVQDACRIMKTLCHDAAFNRSYYQDWPLFKEFITTSEFLRSYEEYYGEPFSSKVDGP